MELIVRITKQHPLQTRQYTDRQGQPQTFTSLGLELQSGADTLYVEAVQEAALPASEQACAG